MPGPSALVDHQHELLDANENSVLLFGTESTGYLTMERPAFPATDARLGDIERPQEDGRAFGRDYLSAKSVVFTIGALTDPINHLDGGHRERTNLNYLSRIEAVWRNERWRNTPSAMMVLRSCEAGQTWRCYGRPRRYEETPGKLTRLGYTPLVATFELIDDRYYSDTVNHVSVGLVPPPDGGLVAPLVEPLASVPETEGQYAATVAGDRSTWPWVTFTGPVVNPSLTIGGTLFIGLIATLTNGQSVTVDTRPWRRTILRENGGNVAGVLNPVTPSLRNCKIEPGEHGLLYRGVDITATSRAHLYWRDARSRP